MSVEKRVVKLTSPSRWTWRQWTVAMVSFLAYAILSVLVLAMYIHPNSATERSDFARTLVQVIGGPPLILGLVATWRNLRVNEQNATENQEANRKREELAAEANVTERFTKAVELLASDKLEARVGAIYALERIALDSERDHWPIMEILTAYVRHHMAWTDPPKEVRVGVAGGSGFAKVIPHIDIQAVMTVLQRRRFDREDPNIHRIDLSRCDLRGVSLIGSSLINADFTYSHLDWANFDNADLTNAVFSWAWIWNTIFQDARDEGMITYHCDTRPSDPEQRSY